MPVSSIPVLVTHRLEAQAHARLEAGLPVYGKKLVPKRAMRLAFADAPSLLRHLRATGVNAQAGQRWSRGRLAAFETRYRDAFGRGGALPLTYHPTFVLAQKTG